jgi:hypothetical protein
VDIVVFEKGRILDCPQVVHKDVFGMKLGGDVRNLALTKRPHLCQAGLDPASGGFGRFLGGCPFFLG